MPHLSSMNDLIVNSPVMAGYGRWSEFYFDICHNFRAFFNGNLLIFCQKGLSYFVELADFA